MPQNKNEILILLNSENSISESLKDYLKLEKMTYNEILDKTVNVENKTLKIVGIQPTILIYKFILEIGGIMQDKEIQELIEKIKKQLKDKLYHFMIQFISYFLQM